MTAVTLTFEPLEAVATNWIRRRGDTPTTTGIATLLNANRET